MSDTKDSIFITDAGSGTLSGGVSGPGSQPTELDGAELDILQLPSAMETYRAPLLPEPEAVAHLAAAKLRLHELLLKMQVWDTTLDNISIDVEDLDAANRDLLDQVMGEGEVSILFANAGQVRIQESVLTGVWRIQHFSSQGELVRDNIQVGPIPDLVRHATFAGCPSSVVGIVEDAWHGFPEGVCNAAPLLAEINERIAHYQPGDMPHTINLTLLPQTEQDLRFLNDCLGTGNTTILSRGYGNCRITSTATRNLWWVRYFNSQDKNILNCLEICAVPDAACAAAEDIADSTQRLREILEVYQ